MSQMAPCCLMAKLRLQWGQLDSVELGGSNTAMRIGGGAKETYLKPSGLVVRWGIAALLAVCAACSQIDVCHATKWTRHGTTMTASNPSHGSPYLHRENPGAPGKTQTMPKKSPPREIK